MRDYGVRDNFSVREGDDVVTHNNGFFSVHSESMFLY